jgi:RNA recognition motif-containing protein
MASEGVVRSIFVANLPLDIKLEELQTVFQEFGTVRNVELKREYGFVLMETAEAAEKAKLSLKDFVIRERE